MDEEINKIIAKYTYQTGIMSNIGKCISDINKIRGNTQIPFNNAIIKNIYQTYLNYQIMCKYIECMNIKENNYKYMLTNRIINNNIFKYIHSQYPNYLKNIDHTTYLINYFEHTYFHSDINLSTIFEYIKLYDLNIDLVQLFKYFLNSKKWNKLSSYHLKFNEKNNTLKDYRIGGNDLANVINDYNINICLNGGLTMADMFKIICKYNVEAFAHNLKLLLNRKYQITQDDILYTLYHHDKDITIKLADALDYTIDKYTQLQFIKNISHKTSVEFFKKYKIDIDDDFYLAHFLLTGALLPSKFGYKCDKNLLKFRHMFKNKKFEVIKKFATKYKFKIDMFCMNYAIRCNNDDVLDNLTNLGFEWKTLNYPNMNKQIIIYKLLNNDITFEEYNKPLFDIIDK